MAWNLLMGKSRPGLQAYVDALDPAAVVAATGDAFSKLLTVGLSSAIAALSSPLKGVGPATATAALAIFDPTRCAYMSDFALLLYVGSRKYTITEGCALFAACAAKAEELSAVSTSGSWNANAVVLAIWSASRVASESQRSLTVIGNAAPLVEGIDFEILSDNTSGSPQSMATEVSHIDDAETHSDPLVGDPEMTSASGAVTSTILPPHGTLSWATLAPDVSCAPLYGGMGVVFKASWRAKKTSALDVAVKVLRGENISPAAFLDAVGRLEKEAELLRAASDNSTNQYVVTLHGVVRGPPTDEWRSRLGIFAPAGREIVGLVMRWETGGSLFTRLHRGSVPWAATSLDRVRLLENIAAGVALLHDGVQLPGFAKQRSLIHGDIKSENVLLSKDGAPRLSDFGIADTRRATSGSTTAASSGKAGGTMCYMAPELFRPAARLSTATDVYALGTLIWEVLSGCLPWDGFNESQRTLAIVVESQTLDLGALPANIPTNLREALARSLAVDPSARLAASELRDALHAAMAVLQAGTFDVFLSHAWVSGAHAPLTTCLHRVLRDDSRAHVWLDTNEMGLRMDQSMNEGVAKSAVVVALVSRHYATRTNCMLELREAGRLGKTIIPVNVDPGTWWPSSDSGSDAERELATIIRAKTTLIVDLRAAAAVANASWATIGAAQIQNDPLLQKPEALPRLLALVDEALGRRERGGMTVRSVTSNVVNLNSDPGGVTETAANGNSEPAHDLAPTPAGERRVATCGGFLRRLLGRTMFRQRGPR